MIFDDDGDNTLDEVMLRMEVMMMIDNHYFEDNIQYGDDDDTDIGYADDGDDTYL